jgi:hypothetical protein
MSLKRSPSSEPIEDRVYRAAGRRVLLVVPPCPGRTQMPEHIDPLDQRPSLGGPEPQIVFVDPAKVRWQFVFEPEMHELHFVEMLDENGELIVRLDVNTADTLLVAVPYDADAAAR